MTIAMVKWALGAVIVPVGLSLAVSGLSVASFQGEQTAKNKFYEEEMLRISSVFKEQVVSINQAISSLENMQRTISQKQIELGVKAEMRASEASRFYSDFQEVRDKVLVLDVKGGR